MATDPDLVPIAAPGTLLIPKDGIRSAELPDGLFDTEIIFVHASPEVLGAIRVRDLTCDQIIREFGIPPDLLGSP